MNASEIRAMNARIALRREEVDAHDDFLAVPVRRPSWSEKVLDIGSELLAIHRDTAEPFPIDLRKDLSPEDAAVVITRRIFFAGGTPVEAERFLRSFELEHGALVRLLREIGRAP
jgi:hypothetical protein